MSHRRNSYWTQCALSVNGGARPNQVSDDSSSNGETIVAPSTAALSKFFSEECPQTLRWNRVMLKVSGEALQGDGEGGIDTEVSNPCAAIE